MVAMNDYVALILGVVCAGIGGELFVRGAVGLGYWARVSPGNIGVTVGWPDVDGQSGKRS